MMVEEIGISHSSVQRIWNAHGLKPHLGACLSNRRILLAEEVRVGFSLAA